MTYMQSETRQTVRNLRKITLANRRLIQAGAIEELARRAMVQFVHTDSLESRIMRVDSVLRGRRIQIIEVLKRCHLTETAHSYAVHIDHVDAMCMQLHPAIHRFR
jgi:hypothetical protein